MKDLIYIARCRLCETLTKWALRISPPGYCPAMVDACLDAFKRRGAFAGFDDVDEQS